MIFVDADPIVYRSGFAAEDVEHEVVYEDAKGELHHIYVSKDWGKKRRRLEKAGCTIHSVDRHVTPKPLEIALHVTATVMRFIAKQREDNLISILSGPGNFRFEVATIKPYKGNRDDSYKPYWYQKIRDYLHDVWNARVVHGHEADDELSILMHSTQEGAAIATIDKDLDQIPGDHFDYMRHVWYHVTPEEANELFWAQVISGDATDNIPGAKGIGIATAKKIIAEATRRWERRKKKPTLERYLWDTCVKVYAKHGVKDYEGDLTPEEITLEQARLVRLLRSPGELWLPEHLAWEKDANE